jgi:hypothetical protein
MDQTRVFAQNTEQIESGEIFGPFIYCPFPNDSFLAVSNTLMQYKYFHTTGGQGQHVLYECK